jgi:cytochrome c oxidase subunit 2
MPVHRPRELRRPPSPIAAGAIAALLAGCQGSQSALDPRGPVASVLAQTWWVMLAGAAVIFILVIALTLYAVSRAPARRPAIGGNTLIVLGGVALPVVTLSALLVYGVEVGEFARKAPADALRVEVIGHQWWWEVRYPDHPQAISANEIHIPVGAPVAVSVSSADVIHSFWVPPLAGKIDALPNKWNRVWLQADEAGVFRGQCAEFCGAQHALMGLLVVAQPRPAFDDWLARQQRPAPKPATPAQVRGLTAFAQAGCAVCHTLRGAGAGGRMGPDLTHLAGRRTLAAGTLPNTPDNLARWLRDNQTIKPGNGMPAFGQLDEKTMRDLVGYLESLQ